jgi:cellulose synthase/poly-beta-1,6-N-acetylglucosamine synthase-like glycosyltransferase
MLTSLFWILFGIIFYTYIGYTLILLCIYLLKKKESEPMLNDSELPYVCLVVAAYNEKSIINKKVENSNKLNYPVEKLHFIWVIDGSNDGSEKELSKFPNIEIIYKPNREGKMAAINRAMEVVKAPITVFCDANTMLHPDSIKWIATSLENKKVGCVAGEKSIVSLKKDSAAGSGEGIYWNYESLIKRLESATGSTLGAAGELFAIRTELFEPQEANTVVDDFVVSLKIALQGYKIRYQPKAIATELASISIREEKKRKIRIAAGSFQVLFSMPELLNIFKHGMLSFKYISHKVLRWLVVPISIPLLLFLNILLLIQQPENTMFQFLIILQAFFYFLVIMGMLLQKSRLSFKIFFIPFYIVVMNYTIILGFIRFLKKNQNPAWEKAQRNS